MGSSDYGNGYGKFVELIAVGSQSSLSGCGSPAQLPIISYFNHVGYVNDATVLSCGGYDP